MKTKIIIPIAIKDKIQFIVDNCDLEVSGLGKVVFDKAENAYRITSAILLDQEVGSAHTDLDDNAVAKALYDTRNEEGELAFWWHSHVNMATFWSTTDHETMESIGKNGLCVAIVFNKKDSMRGAIVMSPEGMPNIKLDDVEIEVQSYYDFDTEALKAEIKEKVRPKKWKQEHTILGSPRDSYLKSAFVGVPSDREEPRLNGTEYERKEALDIWSNMTPTDRNRFVNFKDFYDEYLWGEYGQAITY
jgi:hypothetical protein